MRLLIMLFSPPTGTWGGMTRFVAVAKACEQAGHQVAFCASGSLKGVLRSRNYKVYAAPPTTMLGLPTALSRRWEARSQHMSIPLRPGRSIGSIWLVLLITGLGRAGYLRRLVAAQMASAEDFQPDRLLTDIDPGAFLTAAMTGLPLASTYARIAEHGRGSWPWKLMGRATGRVLHDFGQLDPGLDELFFGPSILKVIPSIPELDGTDPERPDVRYVGRLIGPIRTPADVDFQLEPGRRYIFVYVGTGSISLDILQKVLPRLFPAGAEHLCVVGAQTIDQPFVSGNVIFRPYVPAASVLPHCDWTICHGGQNTIIESLLHGVPLLIFPGPIFERRFNAGKLADAGAGLMGEVNEFNVEWLRAALARQPECAEGAAVLSGRIQSYGGAVAAVAAIASWSGLG